MIRFTNLAHSITLLVIVCGITALTPNAYADTHDDEVPQTRLDVGSTRFTSPQSVAHLKARLRRAALAICAPDWDGRRMIAPDENRCYRTALNSGMAQIDSRQQQAMRQTTIDVAAAQPQDHPVH